MLELMRRCVRRTAPYVAALFLTVIGSAIGHVSLAGNGADIVTAVTGQPGISDMDMDPGRNATVSGGLGQGAIALAFNAIPRQPLDRTPALLSVIDTGHAMIELKGENLPTVTLAATADHETGWNLRATLQNFALAPQNASTAHVAGEGHMHLYVDGTKVARIYGEWFHLPALPEGEHEIRLELNANDHSLFVVDGEPVAATTTITQQAAAPHMKHMEMGATEDLPAATAPGVTLDVRPDPKEGYNVHIQPSGFTLTPENVSKAHVPGEGHVHLYVDDVKVARVYSEWFYLPALENGDHVIRAELNTNDHRAYTTGGGVINASATVTADDMASAEHGHARP